MIVVIQLVCAQDRWILFVLSPFVGNKIPSCASSSSQKNNGGFCNFDAFFVCLDLISVFLLCIYFYQGILSLRYYALEGLSFLVLRFLLLAAEQLDR